MKANFSITELSNLTGKSRPTLYKYMDAYDLGALDELPYSFIALFDLLEKPGTSRQEVIAYCRAYFQKVEEDPALREIFALLRENKDKIDLAALKERIKKEIAK